MLPLPEKLVLMVTRSARGKKKIKKKKEKKSTAGAFLENSPNYFIETNNYSHFELRN